MQSANWSADRLIDQYTGADAKRATSHVNQKWNFIYSRQITTSNFSPRPRAAPLFPTCFALWEKSVHEQHSGRVQYSRRLVRQCSSLSHKQPAKEGVLRLRPDAAGRTISWPIQTKRNDYSEWQLWTLVDFNEKVTTRVLLHSGLNHRDMNVSSGHRLSAFNLPKRPVDA